MQGIQKEAEFGVRTVLDVLEAEVDYLNGSTNLITSEADEIYEMFYVRSVMGGSFIRRLWWKSTNRFET